MTILFVKMSKKSKTKGYSRTDSSTKLTTRALSSGAGGCTYPPTLPQDTTSAKMEKKVSILHHHLVYDFARVLPRPPVADTCTVK